MSLESTNNRQESEVTSSSQPMTGKLNPGAAPRKKRRRRKKRPEAGIPTWRIALAAAISVVIIGATVYKMRATIEEDRMAVIQEAHEREVQLQTNIAQFCAKAGTAPNDQTVADLRGSVNSIMNYRYRDAFNKKYGPQADQLISEAMLLLSDSASASATYEDVNSQVQSLREEIENERKILDEMRSKLNYQSFHVLRQFDMTASGKGIYEAMNASYERCALIAEGSEVSVGATRRVSLPVKSLGSLPVTVTRGNAYRSYDTTEYYPTYETSDEGKEIPDREQANSERRKRLYELRRLLEVVQARLPELSQRFYGFAGHLQGDLRVKGTVTFGTVSFDGHGSSP